jgi:hypothetical protein
MTARRGKTPSHHRPKEMAGFMCPPEAVPSGVRISAGISRAVVWLDGAHPGHIVRCDGFRETSAKE